MENLSSLYNKQAREVSLVPALLFREFDYDLIDTVRIFVLCYKGIAQIEQTLNYKAALGVGEGEAVFLLSHTNTTSVTRSRMLFSCCTHAIGSVALSCSVMHSLTAYSFTNRRKSCCAWLSVSAGGNGACRMSADCNTEPYDAALDAASGVVPIRRYTLLFRVVIRDQADGSRPAMCKCRRLVQIVFS